MSEMVDKNVTEQKYANVEKVVANENYLKEIQVTG